jgi:hypothetical protein
MSGELWARESKVKHLFIDGNQIELKKEAPAPQRFGGRQGGPSGQGGQSNLGAGDSAADVNAAGEWNLLVKSPQGEVNAKLILRKEGNLFSGTLSSQMGDAPLQDISITGGQLRAIAKMNMGGQTVDATITATIEGANIRGAISLPQMGAFDFTGSKPKEEL